MVGAHNGVGAEDSESRPGTQPPCTLLHCLSVKPARLQCGKEELPRLPCHCPEMAKPSSRLHRGRDSGTEKILGRSIHPSPPPCHDQFPPKLENLREWHLKENFEPICCSPLGMMALLKQANVLTTESKIQKQNTC